MYESHFNLDQEPFSIAPDPSFLYLSTAHREALAHLMYGFSHGGFVLITGEVGTGKTTLLRNVLSQTPDDLDVAFILNPRLTVRELLETLCDELGISYDVERAQSIKQFIDALTRHLLHTHQQGRSTVVIIDEAQNLSPAVLEQIRLLTNLETDSRKLLRIILVGQPELTALLARQELRQLAQRITARYHLGPLSREDCHAYVAHRLARAGGHPHIFAPSALRRLFRLSGGIPRIVNVIADRALLGAYSQGRPTVSAANVSQAAAEVLGNDGTGRRRWRFAAAAAAGVAVLGGLLVAGDPAGPESADVMPLAGTGTVAPAEPRRDPATAPAPVVDLDGAPPDPAPAATPAVAPSAGATASTAGALTPPVDTPDTSGTGPEIAASAPAEPLETAAFVEPVPFRPTGSNQAGTVDRPTGTTYETQRNAYNAVFEAWGADYDTQPADVIPCDFAPSAGLQCLTRKGGWRDIEQTNLPVVLELWDTRPNPFYAAVTGLDDGLVTLSVGEQEQTVTQRALRESWAGSYVVLWQTPPGYRGSIRRGDLNDSVGWLRRQLADLTRVDISSSRPDLFDQDLHEAVVEFQRQEGLVTDGVVGPVTWIRLAERLGLPAPGLKT